MSISDDAIPLLPWDDIRYFLAVAQAGSLNAAAAKLGVDHTTVGRRIKTLEGRLGAKLFDRDGNTLRLTPDAQGALEYATQMEETAQTFRRKLHGASDRLDGEVRLNLTEGLATFWLMPRLAPFQAAHPKLRVNWLVTRTPLALGRETDMQILWKSPEEPQAVARYLGPVSYSLFAMPAYAEKFGLPTSIEDLEGHRFIQYNGYEGDRGLAPWNDLIARCGEAVRIENAALTQAAILTGAYITLLPSYAPFVYPTLIKVPVDLGTTTHLHLAYHEDQRKSARVQALADEIQRLFNADKGTWFH